MKREIKFRAWIPTGAGTGDMVQPSTLQEMIYSKSNTFPMVMLKHIDFMQFTGLRDKNGREIYEGDLLRVELDDDPDSYYIAPVTWCGGDYPAFDIMSKYWPKNVSYDTNVLSAIVAGWSEEVMTVIGNIYENPELLETDK